MSGTKLPIGSATGQDGRPRAQVAYEGEDEFSTMSLDPERKRVLKKKETLEPSAPGEKQHVKVNELKPMNDQGVVGFLRKIFAK
ncbi:MAG: hypothetical protein AMXMBFR34_02040 [Myxococcaceae bacterium]